MIVVHEMDIHFMKNKITLSGCDITNTKIIILTMNNIILFFDVIIRILYATGTTKYYIVKLSQIS
jgi:hypothetical protein